MSDSVDPESGHYSHIETGEGANEHRPYKSGSYDTAFLEGLFDQNADHSVKDISRR
jgi:hypothetical protein